MGGESCFFLDAPELFRRGWTTGEEEDFGFDDNDYDEDGDEETDDDEDEEDADDYRVGGDAVTRTTRR